MRLTITSGHKGLAGRNADAHDVFDDPVAHAAALLDFRNRRLRCLQRGETSLGVGPAAVGEGLQRVARLFLRGRDLVEGGDLLHQAPVIGGAIALVGDDGLVLRAGLLDRRIRLIELEGGVGALGAILDDITCRCCLRHKFIEQVGLA